MTPDVRKTLSQILRQVARLLGIDNGHVRIDFKDGQPKVIEPTPVIRLGGPQFDEADHPDPEMLQ